MDFDSALQKQLVESALKARERAYAPYSNFCVGAALLCADGTVYAGANVENSSFGGTICAERSAFVAAISEGKREFSAIAIVGGKQESGVKAFCPPCGICRQFMAEFCPPEFPVLLFDGYKVLEKTLAELLPDTFQL